MKYTFKNKFIKRYDTFLQSDISKNIPDYSKSEYWKYHASEVNIRIEGNTIHASGQSGFYAPVNRGLYETFKKILSILVRPSKIISLIKQMIGIPVSGIKLLNTFDAFDRVMKADIITEPQLSPYRINFLEMKHKKNICMSVKDAKLNFSQLTKCNKLYPHMMMAYYYFNIMLSYTDINIRKDLVVLEIGGGNGNLLSLIKKNRQEATCIDVDLPETISHAILFLKDQFPEAKILMPNELGNTDIQFLDYDFVFLTPNQVHLIPDNLVDISINNHSFQEMTFKQIDEYFQLIQRAGKNNSYFFTANRVEKIPGRHDSKISKISTMSTIRFSDYPWNTSNEIIVYEICRLLRLVQLDSIFNRLERINK